MFLKRVAGESPLAGNLRLSIRVSSFWKTGNLSEVDVDTSSLIWGNEFLIKLHQSDTDCRETRTWGLIMPENSYSRILLVVR